MKNILSIIVALLAFAISTNAQTKSTLAISEIKTTPALETKIANEGRKLDMDRLLQAMNANLSSAMNATSKFEIVSRSDLDSIKEELDFANSGNVDTSDVNTPQTGKLKGAKYLLVVNVDDYQDYTESASFKTLNKNVTRRIIRFGVVAKIIDTQTGAILQTANIVLSNNDLSEMSMKVLHNGNLNDKIIAEMARLMSSKIANTITDFVFPIRVIAKTGKFVTVNRGQGTGINVGDVYIVYAVGEDMIDPDTGESLGSEEVQIGKIMVESITPKFSKCVAVEDYGISKMHIVRKN